MLENKKVIIFDLDGTLIDSIGIWNAIDEELIKQIGNIPLGNENIAKQRDDMLKKFQNEPDMYLAYCGFLKEKYQSTLTKEEIKALRYEIADDYLKNKIDYKPNAEKVLKYLKQKGYILVIASTTLRHCVAIYQTQNKNIINKANLNDMFSLILTKDDVITKKPSPEVHEKVMEKLKVTKEQCLIIEDSLIGVEAGKNAGIEVAVMYDQYTNGDREQIDKLANYQFRNFNEMLEQIKEEG
ncbi:MAG: HAD family phosphatase [Clostridia bacterium]|nr:HAD family phosphatase [Clostridia bacterium]